MTGTALLLSLLPSCQRPNAGSSHPPDALGPGALDDRGLDSDFGSAASAENLPIASSSQAPKSSSPFGIPRDIHWADIERATHAGRPGYLLRQLQPVAYRPHGRFIGWQIQSLFPDDPELCAHGCFLRVGDVVVSVNGSNLERPQELASAFEQLPQLRNLRIRILRGGRLIDRVFGIQGRPAVQSSESSPNSPLKSPSSRG